MRKFMTIVVMNMLLLVAAIATSEARPKASKISNLRTMTKASPAPADKVTVKIANFTFTPATVTITAGTTVEWVNEAGRHTVEADNGAFKSGVLTAGGKFEFKFDKAGTYAYHCGFHGAAGGKDMAGKVIVKAARKK